MQPQIMVIFMDENLRSEFIDLHLTSLNSVIIYQTGFQIFATFSLTFL